VAVDVDLEAALAQKANAGLRDLFADEDLAQTGVCSAQASSARVTATPRSISAPASARTSSTAASAVVMSKMSNQPMWPMRTIFRRFEPVGQEQPEGDVEGANERNGRSERRVELRLPFARAFPVHDVTRCAGACGSFERSARDRREPESGRAHQCLLRTGHDDVDPPEVRLERHRAEARHRI